MNEVKFSDLCKFQPKQSEVIDALKDNKYVLAGGAAGGGKSYLLRWAALRYCFYYYTKYGVKNGRVGIFCEDYPTLNDRQLSKIEFEFPQWLGRYNGTDKEYRLNDMYGGWTITFRNLDNISKYLSSEWAAVFVDEITMNTRDIFDFLNLRLRWVGIPEPRFLACTNPGGPGHTFVKKLWIDRDFTDERLDPAEFKFVPFKYSDNKYIDKSYEKQLASLPEQMRKAYMDGDWNIFAGQFFGEWRAVKHIVEPFSIPKTWELFAGLDYGYNSASGVVFIAFDPAEKRYYVFDEIYTNRKTYEELAQMILDKGHDIKYVIADPAIWAKKDSPQSGAMAMERVLKYKEIKMIPGDNNRINGWGILREVLKDSADGKPSLMAFNHCSNFIRTFPAMSCDKHKIEDVDTDCDDHIGDSLRYAIFWHKKNKKPASHSLLSAHDEASEKPWHIQKEQFDQSEESLFTFD